MRRRQTDGWRWRRIYTGTRDETVAMMVQRVRGHGGASSVCSMHERSSPGLLDGRYYGIAVHDDDEPDGGNGARLCMQELDEMEVAMN